MEVYTNERSIRLVAGRIPPGCRVAQVGSRVIGFAEPLDTGFFKGWMAWKTEYTAKGGIKPFGIAKKFPDADTAADWLRNLIDEHLDSITAK